MGRLLSVIALFALACSARGSQPTQARTAVAPRDAGAKTSLSETSEPFDWQAHTRSPQPSEQTDPRLGDLGKLCEGSDAALERVAARLARRHVAARPSLDVSEIAFALRAEGCPYVWPRAWMLEGPFSDGARARERMQRWLATFDDGGERRCGVALASSGAGREVVVAVAADVLGELGAFPTRVRVGKWLDVSAELAVAASEAKVVILGPKGAPRAVPTSLDGQRIRARFVADHAGTWLVQVLATVAGGPRQILEAMTFAGVEPERSYTSSPAPGEDGAWPDDTLLSLFRMLNGARVSEGLVHIPHLRDLDEAAQAHAEAMRDAGRIAHDLGRGDPKGRLEERGTVVRAAGENVAHAIDAVHAHRALWKSPAHRRNLLDPHFDAIGIGAAVGADGTLWVSIVFADLYPNRIPPT